MASKWEYAYVDYQWKRHLVVWFSHRDSPWNLSKEIKERYEADPAMLMYPFRRLGDEGWECLGYDRAVGSWGAVFKRPLE